MDNRCLHELKTSGTATAAQKMLETVEDDNSIMEESELGQSVLTLGEAVQTFTIESQMFNIKLDQDDYRTVVLHKNEVQIDGKTKLIVMVRDLSDKVRLEQV